MSEDKNSVGTALCLLLDKVPRYFYFMIKFFDFHLFCLHQIDKFCKSAERCTRIGKLNHFTKNDLKEK